MLTLEHKKRRQSGLGGSDIGILMGVNPYKTPYDLFMDKTTPILDEEEITFPQAVWGHLLEPLILEHYCEINKDKDFILDTHWKNDTVIIHQTFPYLLASPDALFIKRTGDTSYYTHGLEIKTTASHNAKKWGDEYSKKIPISYYYQICHYMLVTGIDHWDVAVLIGGNDYRVYSFERDTETENKIIEKAHDFWNNNVLKNIPPCVK